MGWTGTLGVTLLTTILGGIAGAGVAALLIDWLHISNFESGSGYFAFFVTLIGVVAGFITGLITALTVRTDFWKAQGYAAGVLAILAILAGVLPVLLNDEGPKLDGQKLTLQVQLKCAPEWKPDRSRAGLEYGHFCWLQRYPVDAASEVNPIRNGGIKVTENDGRWIAICAFDLPDTRRRRYVRIFLSKKTDVSIEVPLPRYPGRKFQQWSEWSTSGFFPQKDSPVPANYTYRFRVQTESEYRRENPDPQVVMDEARKQMLAAMPADAPLAQWLPLFETSNGEPANPPDPDATWKMLQAKSAELAPLLRSPDPVVRRRAVFAAATYQQLPVALLKPLVEAGEHTVELIRQASAANPDEPDLAAENRAYTYYTYWCMAIDRAGAKGKAAAKPVFEKIEAAARQGPKEGRIHDIAESAAAK